MLPHSSDRIDTEQAFCEVEDIDRRTIGASVD